MKKFLHAETAFFQLPRYKIIIGLLVGLFFSFSFYSFLYLNREAFRIISLTDNYDLWTLSDKEVNFYNLIYAYISLIMGQSICFSFWLDSSKRVFGEKNYIKKRIIHDQRVLNWYFLSWFSKLAIVYGITFGILFYRGFYVFSFYPDYNYVFILILIVLFLQTWNTIRIKHKRKSLKWMLFSFLLISILAFGFSRINLIDYKAINKIYLQKNMHYSYKLELAESDFYEYLNGPAGLIQDIYIVEGNTSNENSKPIIVFNNEELPLSKLHNKIEEEKTYVREFNLPFIRYRLYIHKSIKMGFVNQVQDELLKANAYNIAYAVIPASREYDKRYYQCSLLIRLQPNFITDSINIKDRISKIDKEIPNIIEIKYAEGGFEINKSLIKTNEIEHSLKVLIHSNTDYIIKYYVDDDMTFSDYIIVLSGNIAAVHDLRNEYSKKKYAKEYSLLDDKKMAEVRRKIPLKLIWITEELLEEMESE